MPSPSASALFGSVRYDTSVSPSRAAISCGNICTSGAPSSSGRLTKSGVSRFVRRSYSQVDAGAVTGSMATSQRSSASVRDVMANSPPLAAFFRSSRSPLIDASSATYSCFR